jgi:hypothetical protein
MKRLSRPRDMADLSDSLHDRLNTYALAAGAAGVSVLALAQPTEAKIVYTRVHRVIDYSHRRYSLDLNHDGIKDFRISATVSGNRCGLSFKLYEVPTKGNSAEGTNDVRALYAGSRIGNSQGFYGGKGMMARAYVGSFNGHCDGNVYLGSWRNATDRYLGLVFRIHGKIHYGWARLSVTFLGFNHYLGGWRGTLTGYAYETIPGKSIIAGKTKGSADERDPEELAPVSLIRPIRKPSQPASLGMLALGAQGLPLWRRKEKSEVAR